MGLLQPAIVLERGQVPFWFIEEPGRQAILALYDTLERGPKHHGCAERHACTDAKPLEGDRGEGLGRVELRIRIPTFGWMRTGCPTRPFPRIARVSQVTWRLWQMR